MKIYFTNAGLKSLYIKRLLNIALTHLKQPSKQLEMSLSIVSPQEIQQLNKQYRQVDSVTDVLSFPTVDNPSRGVLDLDQLEGDINPQTGRLNIGDVIICLDRAKEQAVSYNHSLKREIAFLSLHGLLHLLGYDHMNQEDEQQMFTLQNEILALANITRDVK